MGRRAAVAVAEDAGGGEGPEGPGENADAWWDKGEKVGKRDKERTRCAACDSARNERIGQQHIAKAAPQRLRVVYEIHTYTY